MSSEASLTPFTWLDISLRTKVKLSQAGKMRCVTYCSYRASQPRTAVRKSVLDVWLMMEERIQRERVTKTSSRLHSNAQPLVLDWVGHSTGRLVATMDDSNPLHGKQLHIRDARRNDWRTSHCRLCSSGDKHRRRMPLLHPCQP